MNSHDCPACTRNAAPAPGDPAFDKTIEVARLGDDSLQLVFLDGSELRIADNAQACCERRWMSCDDELEGFTGDRYLGFDVLDGGDGPDGEDIQFCHVRTSGGTITLQTHNEHNGFYGGFDVVASYRPNVAQPDQPHEWHREYLGTWVPLEVNTLLQKTYEGTDALAQRRHPVFALIKKADER